MQISKKALLCFFSVLIVNFCCLRIDSVFYLTSWGNVYKEIPIVLLCITIGFLMIKKEHFSTMMKLILLYFIFLYLVTIVSGGKWHVTLVNITPAVVMCMITDYYMKRNWTTFVRCTAIVLTWLLIFDFITIIICPSGLYSTNLYTDNWILGYKTAHANVALPAISLTACNSMIRRGRITMGAWLCVFVGLADTILCGATGGSIAITLLILLIILCFKIPTQTLRKCMLKVLDIRIIIPSILLLNVLIVFLQNLKVFEHLIVGVLDKSMTLTGRTTIWTACLGLFKSSPLWGKGYLDATQFVAITRIGGGTQPHNLIMSILVYSGMIGLVIYFISLFRAFSFLDRTQPNISSIIAFWIVCNLVLGISSMNLFSTYQMAAMIILEYMGRYVQNNEI